MIISGGIAFMMYIVYKQRYRRKKLRKLAEKTKNTAGEKELKMTRKSHSVVQRLALSHFQVIGLVGQFNVRYVVCM